MTEAAEIADVEKQVSNCRKMSKGWQIMARDGWQPGQGLGSKGEDRVNPIESERRFARDE